jgi:glycosyltransferase involved in cell wall biosynthesis
LGKTAYILKPKEMPALLSLVIPIYNEEEVLPLLIARLEELLAKLPCPAEVVMVNDGSADNSVQQLYELSQRDKRFKVLCFARNFGHQIAATAGLDAASGDAIVLMDADLQDPPELIFDMLDRYREGYDVVYAQRSKRTGETFFKRASAWLFYRFMATLVYKDLPVDSGDYRLISRRFLNALNQMRETHRFLRGMVAWVGFPQIAVPFVRAPRAAGETKYPLSKMLRFAWTAAISFSPLPLQASFFVGSGFFSIGCLYAVYALVRWVTGLYLVPGWTSLILVSCLGTGGVMILIGVLGEYVARIYEEIKGRPLYVVSDQFNVTPVSRAAGSAHDHVPGQPAEARHSRQNRVEPE